ncbi:MAG: ribosome-associated heat shock protein Hsp15 [Verrucomicrobia bacterium]|nr:MAG: ribosome-associated heat shock protein Hsp15 [Verrucomicrobiota bacterium]
MRLDLWLWAVRAYKTRPLAVSAIKNGRVEIGGLPTKPSRIVRAGEEVALRIDTDVTIWTRTLCVLETPRTRVGAKLVPLYVEDRTPPEELEKARLRPGSISGFRPRGAGRPTKRDRRAWDELDGGEEETAVSEK